MNHLEQSNAAYAEDLLQKSALIEHYFRISKAGWLTEHVFIVDMPWKYPDPHSPVSTMKHTMY